MITKNKITIHLFILLTVFFVSETKEISISVLSYDAAEFRQREAIPIILEHAQTTDEITWGLMQREFLPPNQGMLFYYPCKQKVMLWSFNCLINLSVAFLDEDGTIQEIRTLNAYPNKMDPCRPVESVEDFALYPSGDPIRKFFLSRAIVSSFPSAYVLEMNDLWFQENGVQVGDVLGWDDCPGNGWVMLTLDISCARPTEERPVLLTLTTETAQSLWLAHDPNGRDIAFLDAEYRIVKIVSLPGGQKYAPRLRPVAFSDGPIKHTLIAQPGWLTRNQIYVQDELKIKD